MLSIWANLSLLLVVILFSAVAWFFIVSLVGMFYQTFILPMVVRSKQAKSRRKKDYYVY